jgi:hypothetical protein
MPAVLLAAMRIGDQCMRSSTAKEAEVWRAVLIWGGVESLPMMRGGPRWVLACSGHPSEVATMSMPEMESAGWSSSFCCCSRFALVHEARDFECRHFLRDFDFNFR